MEIVQITWYIICGIFGFTIGRGLYAASVERKNAEYIKWKNS